MADTELSSMTAAGTLTGTELIYGTQSDADRKLTPAQIKTYALSPYGTLPATDGTDGDVLTTNGAGALSWEVPASGGGGGVAGADTQVQFNDAGAMAGDAGLTFNKTSNVLSAAGGIGDGVDYLMKFDTGEVAVRFRNPANSAFTSVEAESIQAGDGNFYSRMSPLTYAITISGQQQLGLVSSSYDNQAGLRCGTGHGVYFSQNAGVGTASDMDAGFIRSAAGVIEVNNGTTGTLRDMKMRDVTLRPSLSLTPANNGDLVIQATSNTSLTFKYKGSDGTVRSASLTLA